MSLYLPKLIIKVTTSVRTSLTESLETLEEAPCHAEIAGDCTVQEIRLRMANENQEGTVEAAAGFTVAFGH